jgi:hypothetical protein
MEERTWTANTVTEAGPERVLGILTDPDEIARWAPIPFRVEDMDNTRLVAGSRARVSGSLIGRRVGFDVEVHRADTLGLELSARGPVAMSVRYDVRAASRGAEVSASVSVRPGSGLGGRLLAEATNGLLKAGALQTAVSRIAREATAVI